MPKLSIIIPTYNEEGNIVTLINKVHTVLNSINTSHEIIIVDDNSKDKTRPLIKELQANIPEIILIERNNERGLASAMVAGYEKATGELLGAMDADLAHDPSYLPEMLSIIASNKADFVIGSRYVLGSKFEGKALLNKVASLVGQTLIKILLGLNIKDTSNNYRIFKRAVWGKIKNNLHPDGNVMLTEIVYLAHKNNFRILEIPIHYIERRAGKSKLSVFKETFKFFKNIWKIRNGA